MLNYYFGDDFNFLKLDTTFSPPKLFSILESLSSKHQSRGGWGERELGEAFSVPFSGSHDLRLK